MNKPTILVVDDSLTARMKLKELLEGDGAAVLLAENASQATELALEHQPDVVILDVVLPDGNGIEICKRWRDDPALKDTLVLLISGERSGHDDRAAGLRAGALGYTVKPFSDPELLAQVGMLVRLNDTLREMREAKEAAVAANRTKDESLATLSHELAERERAEQALLREKQKLDDVTGSATCGLLLLDEHTRIVYANRTVQDWFGSLGQITGRECCEVFGVQRNEEECAGLKALRVRRTVHGRVFTRTIGGEDRSLYVIASPLEDAHGRIRQIAEAVVDITEQMHAEEEMRRLRLLLKNMIDSMPSSLVAVDAEGRVTHWNRRAEEATGVSSEEAQGQPLHKVFPVMETQLGQVREALRRREAKSVEKVETYVDGVRHFSDVMVDPLVTNGVDGAVIRVDDVTERVRLEEMMIQSEKMLSVGVLAAGMAHEINNPLAGIMQNVQVVLDRISTELPANVEAARDVGINLGALSAYMDRRKIIDRLDSVRKSGKRAARIVENILSFSRKSDAHFSPHNLSGLIDQTVELAASDYDLKKKFDFKQIEIVREFDSDLPEVTCEGPKIQQVILNLLKNGAQAMEEQKDRVEPPRFILRTLRDGDMARIEVEDNGPGITDEIRKRIFEPFFTTKDVGSGTGLGLSVSYFIVTENHGGTMTVESTPGTGAKFTIRLSLQGRA